jgi:hypothetical protein
LFLVLQKATCSQFSSSWTGDQKNDGGSADDYSHREEFREIKYAPEMKRRTSRGLMACYQDSEGEREKVRLNCEPSSHVIVAS